MKQNNNPSRNLSSFSIHYDRVLNPPQLEAVMFGEGPALVVAGAGSGKTRTLVYRVARLVEEGVLPNRILLLTFTRKAAQEMLKRSVRLLDHRCGRVSGGTFHSFANSVLRRHADKLGFSLKYSIIDRADTESLIGLLRKEIIPSSSKRGFPTKRTLANIFSRAVNKDITIEEIIDEDYLHFSGEIETILRLHQLYSQHKSEHMFFDYDDLLIYLKILLETHTDIRGKLCDTYRYVLVDEYQDTNKMQAEILYLLAENHQNIMAVGDDSQSIYSFRGANFENILRFPDIFPNTRIIRLEENYRSTRHILDLTNTILERAKRKYAKHLFTSKPGGTLPSLVYTGDENNQSRFIIEKILEFRAQGIPLSQLAVLFRAGFHSFDLEIELNREGIPFVKVGGFKFMESAHIKDVLAHLRVIVNPVDRISWFRILNRVERIGPKTAEAIYKSGSAERDVRAVLHAADLKPGQMKALERLMSLYSELDDEVLSVAQMGERIVSYYLPYLEKQYDDHPKRIKDLHQLVTIMERYNDLYRFLTDMALEPPNSSMDDSLFAGDGSEERLVLSTVHSAKGLEWHTVFIIWTLDGRFPSLQAMEKESDVEEELRLMYVAATRARENLFFTCPGNVYDRITNRYLTRPSRFIDGIPDEILEKYAVGTDGWGIDF